MKAHLCSSAPQKNRRPGFRSPRTSETLARQVIKQGVEFCSSSMRATLDNAGEAYHHSDGVLDFTAELVNATGRVAVTHCLIDMPQREVKMILSTIRQPNVVTGAIGLVHPDGSIREQINSASEGELLTVQEIAEFLKVPVSWVYVHVRRRSADPLPGYRIGKYWRFRAEEVRAWVRRHATI